MNNCTLSPPERVSFSTAQTPFSVSKWSEHFTASLTSSFSVVYRVALHTRQTLNKTWIHHGSSADRIECDRVTDRAVTSGLGCPRWRAGDNQCSMKTPTTVHDRRPGKQQSDFISLLVRCLPCLSLVWYLIYFVPAKMNVL